MEGVRLSEHEGAKELEGSLSHEKSSKVEAAARPIPVIIYSTYGADNHESYDCHVEEINFVAAMFECVDFLRDLVLHTVSDSLCFLLVCIHCRIRHN